MRHPFLSTKRFFLCVIVEIWNGLEFMIIATNIHQLCVDLTKISLECTHAFLLQYDIGIYDFNELEYDEWGLSSEVLLSLQWLSCTPLHDILRLTEDITYIYNKHKSVTNCNFQRKCTVWNMLWVVKDTSNKTMF